MEKEYDDATVKNLNRGRNYSRFIDSFIEIITGQLNVSVVISLTNLTY